MRSHQDQEQLDATVIFESTITMHVVHQIFWERPTYLGDVTIAAMGGFNHLKWNKVEESEHIWNNSAHTRELLPSGGMKVGG